MVTISKLFLAAQHHFVLMIVLVLAILLLGQHFFTTNLNHARVFFTNLGTQVLTITKYICSSKDWRDLRLHYLPDADALDVSRPSLVLDGEREPVRSRASVNLECNVLVRVITWDSFIENIIQSNVAKLLISSRKGHVGHCGATQVKCRLPCTAVYPSWARVCNHNPGGL